MKKFLTFYFLFAFCFFSFFASGFVDSQDAFQYLAVTRRIYYDHTFELPEASFKEGGQNIHMSIAHGSDGQKYSPTGLGFSLALLPAVIGEDIFLRLANIEPITKNFPLSSDWPVLLFASMTNAFFGALLAITLYQYLRSLKLNHQNALLISFIGILSTNLWAYTKHSFPHMMFVSFLTLSFYFIKKYSLENKFKYVFWSALSYGVVILAYNPTYLLPLPALGIYYLLLLKPKLNLESFKKRLAELMVAVIGVLPFASLYLWFNRFRFHNVGLTSYTKDGTIPIPSTPQLNYFFDGLWGFLFSPGKSLFLFSPILLLIIIFWSKIKKEIVPELIAFLVLLATYLYIFAGRQYWHGDSSWGPRYLLPILPLGIVVVGYIYKKLNLKKKMLTALPLVLIGVFVELVGVLLPYQVRFWKLPHRVKIGAQYKPISDIGQFVPRYSPVFNQSKLLVNRVIKKTKSIGDNPYQVKLFDGWHSPFDAGFTTWRGMYEEGYISFLNQKTDRAAKEISLRFKNHQLVPNSSYSAQLRFELNNEELAVATLAASVEQNIQLDLKNKSLKGGKNVLKIENEYVGTSVASLDKKQVVFLQQLILNHDHIDLNSFYYPYVSPVSKNLFGVEYQYLGQELTDPWEIWHLHSAVYENTFDLWWLRPFHYWDMPKGFFIGLLGVNLIGVSYFGWRVLVYRANDE